MTDFTKITGTPNIEKSEAVFYILDPFRIDPKGRNASYDSQEMTIDACHLGQFFLQKSYFALQELPQAYFQSFKKVSDFFRFVQFLEIEKTSLPVFRSLSSNQKMEIVDLIELRRLELESIQQLMVLMVNSGLQIRDVLFRKEIVSGMSDDLTFSVFGYSTEKTFYQTTIQIFSKSYGLYNPIVYKLLSERDAFRAKLLMLADIYGEESFVEVSKRIIDCGYVTSLEDVSKLLDNWNYLKDLPFDWSLELLESMQ